MWQAMILASLLSVTSYYSVADAVMAPQPQPAKGAELASSMAVYRETVLAYLRAHPDFQGDAVPDDIIQSMLPSWYIMPKGKGAHALWAHRICTDGTVAVFAEDKPPVNITQDIIKLSRHSAAVGESLGGGYYYALAKVHGANKHGLHINDEHDASESAVAPLPGCAAVAAGRPIWIASYR